MKAFVIRNNGDVSVFERVSKVEQGAGAVSITQTVEQAQQAGLIIAPTKQAEKRTIIPWSVVHEVVVE